MESLLTFGFFAIVTSVSVAWHLRRQKDKANCPAVGLVCPRCGAGIPEENLRCPGCGVPRQLFEVVSAKTVSGEAAASEGDAGAAGAAHAVVRADRCVGCATCVPACPEEGAIRLEGKLAVVDIDLCKGHGSCVAACPVGGIALTSGDAVQRVEVPEVSATFESNVPGVYIVGELGGRGLIKNAVNEGKVAVERVAAELAGQPPERPVPGLVDVAIVGSGPAGISAGLQAMRSGLSYVILEQGSLADSIRKYPRHKVLLAEPLTVPLYGDLWVADTSKESLLEVWENVIRSTGLRVLTEHRMEVLECDGSVFHLRTPRGEFQARKVVLALGRRGTPRRLNVPGEELSKVFYDIVEMEPFQGRNVLVVGGGDSAVESALGLANQPGATVWLSYRGEEFARVKERNLEKLQAATAAGTLTVLLSSQVLRIGGKDVELDHEGRRLVLPNDDVIIRIGGEPPVKLLERIGVRMIQKDVPLMTA